MEKEVYQIAKKRVRKKKGFYTHFSVFVAVGIFLFLINLATYDDSGVWWFFFPLISWSVALFIHYFSVFGLPGTDILTKDWEDREIEREAKRIRGQLPPLPATEEMDELELPELRRVKDENWRDEDLV